uniref:Uncharacterized protein n=1 Tax=Arundo donax TaxID=35708 RepID=A0A0A9BYT7_ARUDO
MGQVASLPSRSSLDYHLLVAKKMVFILALRNFSRHCAMKKPTRHDRHNQSDYSPSMKHYSHHHKTPQVCLPKEKATYLQLMEITQSCLVRLNLQRSK